MKPESYRQRWEQLKADPDASRVEHLAKQIALSFLDHHFYNNQYRSDYIDLLCEMATMLTDPEISKTASSALFGIVVESLCDDFEDLNTETYNRLMSQVISYYRKTSRGDSLDKELQNVGLNSAENVFERIEQIRAASNECKTEHIAAPEKIVVLSRVTLGADVAITSVIMQYLQDLFPDSQLVLLGGEKLHDLFGGNNSLKIKTVDYSRRGSLADRLDTWHNVREAIAAATQDVSPEKVLVVDPDSRLSQLGVFPLVESAPYLFFDSRSQTKHPKHATMAEITNAWLNSVFNTSAFYYPKVWLREYDLTTSQQTLNQLRANGCSRIISVNFGVGGNERKRLSTQAEEKLIRQLLTTPDTVVMLDKGAGQTEQNRIEQLASAVAEAGFPVTQPDSFGSTNSESGNLRHGLCCVSTSIGEMAAVIAHADEYIGYDSACQHIAAALEVPTCTIFAGSNDPDFVQRWCATGRGPTKLVHVDTLTTPPMFDDDDIVARIIHARSEEYQP